MSQASDQQVDAKIVLQAIADVKRRGIHRLMEELEAREPDLASHVMEELSLVYQRLSALGGRVKATRRVHELIEALVLVVITSLTQAHYQLWRKEVDGMPLAALNPDPPGADPQRPTSSESKI
jgi:hypothetical protein